MGPTGAGKSDSCACAGRTAAAGNHQRRFRAGVPRHGHRHGQAGPHAARAHSPSFDRHTRSQASYSAGEFVRDAQQAMQEIWRRGRQPLLVGGTMLYFHALSAGHCGSAARQTLSVRAAIDAQAAEVGWAAVHEELASGGSAGGRTHSRQRSAAHPAGARSVSRSPAEPITKLQQQRAVGVCRRKGHGICHCAP